MLNKLYMTLQLITLYPHGWPQAVELLGLSKNTPKNTGIKPPQQQQRGCEDMKVLPKIVFLAFAMDQQQTRKAVFIYGFFQNRYFLSIEKQPWKPVVSGSPEKSVNVFCAWKVFQICFGNELHYFWDAVILS